LNAKSSRRMKIAERFEKLRGYWPTDFDHIIRNDEVFFELVSELSNHPWERNILDKKLKELVLLAINASTTHLNEQGIRQHMRGALLNGATKEEITEVLELTSVLGIHSCTVGVPILVKEVSKIHAAGDSTPLTSRQIEIREDFKKERGYWSDELWGALLGLDPDYLQKYTNYSSHPWKHGVLPPKIKELIYTAIDASTTHLYEPGLRQHISNALRYGATPQEILEVLEVVVEIGLQTCEIGFKILDEVSTKI